MIVSLIGWLAVSSGCEPAADSTTADTPGADFRPVVNQLQFMVWVLEPAADVVWDSAGSIITIDGEEDLAPQTDEEWSHVRNQAAVIAEAGNLLMLPGRAIDDGAWMEYSGGLREAGIRLMKAAEVQDADELFDAGAGLYQVCLACHMTYAQHLR
jgi:hypothetical protein